MWGGGGKEDGSPPPPTLQGRSKQIYSGQAIMFSFIIVIVMT